MNRILQLAKRNNRLVEIVLLTERKSQNARNVFPTLNNLHIA
jgi:hypothetical protein